MNKIFIFLITMCSLSYTYANSPIIIQNQIQWEEDFTIHNPTGAYPIEILEFDGATYDFRSPQLPYAVESISIPSYGALTIELSKAEYEPLKALPKGAESFVGETIDLKYRIHDQRRKLSAKVYFIPIRQIAPGRYEKLVRYELRIQHTPSIKAQKRGGPTGTFNSVLADGSIYKIAVTEEGIQKLDYDFLKNELKIDIDNIDPNTIKVYGNGGGMLPQFNNVERYDDLEENAIWIAGGDDGSFDNQDFILFYGEAADKWAMNQSGNLSLHKNPFDNNNYYFIKISPDNGLRLATQSSLTSTSYQTTSFDDFQRFEEEDVNLLSDGTGTQGTGQRWFGESFNTTRERTKSFTFPNLITSEPIYVEVALAARGRSSSTFTVEVNNQKENSSNMSSVRLGDVESQFANLGFVKETFNVQGDQVDVQIAYPPRGDGTNVGWLDYVEVKARRALNFTGKQMKFQDLIALSFPSTSFQLSGVSANTQIWDISDPLKPKMQEVNLSGNSLEFGLSSTELRQFVAFDATSSSLIQPTAVGEIANQNIHALDDLDMIILYHPEFEDATNKLASHRRSYSGLEVATVNIFDLYNEFSSGRQDPTAIRDFARLLYERNDRFRYLLLMGDGSFDYKNIYNTAKEGEEKNFIPVFETSESLHPISGFPSDDYFAMLSENEGASLQGGLDIALGRMLVRSSSEANTVVDKIIRYDTEPVSLRDWRNRITFVADDQDNNIHIRDADKIAVQIDTTHRVFNINKIYLDAYQQESTPGGARFPQAQEALNRDLFRGALTVNYLGHGGSKGWAQERVLTIKDILSWKNKNQLPLFITATCSFTGYDEPTLTTAGEEAFLNPNGGVIGLFTTVRAVYASSNFRLTKSVFDNIFNDPDATIGEILMRSKNATLDNTNARKFTLVGDPSMKLAIPRLGVTTTQINGTDVTTGTIDTLRALQEGVIKGYVTDENGQLKSDFNGKIYPTIFDKKIRVSTLGQDEDSSIREFDIQRNVLFKGVASVTNGQFEFKFVVPKDIDYNYGFGKISYYAENNQQLDARGFFEKVVIGGADESGFKDDQEPLVEVFMNNEDFIIGGQTDENPTLFVKLSDDNGINVAGSSIGHDLSGVLDNDTQNSYILNDFYESEQDNHKRGTVKFPLFDLEPGKHVIKVKAWDIANNSAEGFTEFIVANSEETALAHVLNYPNPFTTSTNFQFEFNQTNQPLDVQVQIFTVSGRLVKTVEDQVFNEGSLLKLPWDGRDDYGDRLAKGVYVYKVKVRTAAENTQSIKAESDFEKLVILK